MHIMIELGLHWTNIGCYALSDNWLAMVAHIDACHFITCFKLELYIRSTAMATQCACSEFIINALAFRAIIALNLCLWNGWHGGIISKMTK